MLKCLIAMYHSIFELYLKLAWFKIMLICFSLEFLWEQLFKVAKTVAAAFGCDATFKNYFPKLVWQLNNSWKCRSVVNLLNPSLLFWQGSKLLNNCTWKARPKSWTKKTRLTTFLSFLTTNCHIDPVPHPEFKESGFTISNNPSVRVLMLKGVYRNTGEIGRSERLVRT